MERPHRPRPGRRRGAPWAGTTSWTPPGRARPSSWTALRRGRRAPPRVDGRPGPHPGLPGRLGRPGQRPPGPPRRHPGAPLAGGGPGRCAGRCWSASATPTRASSTTPPRAPSLLVRPRDPTDSAVPSGTSLAVELLRRAGHLFDETAWSDAAPGPWSPRPRAWPAGPPASGTCWASSRPRCCRPSRWRWSGRPRTRPPGPCWRPRSAPTCPSGCVAGGSRAPPAASACPCWRGGGCVDGAPAAYVCSGYACKAPVADPSAVTRELDTAPA